MTWALRTCRATRGPADVRYGPTFPRKLTSNFKNQPTEHFSRWTCEQQIQLVRQTRQDFEKSSYPPFTPVLGEIWAALQIVRQSDKSAYWLFYSLTLRTATSFPANMAQIWKHVRHILFRRILKNQPTFSFSQLTCEQQMQLVRANRLDFEKLVYSLNFALYFSKAYLVFGPFGPCRTTDGI